MAIDQFQYTTGQSQMPDIGTLAYNGCTFSPLATTEVSGRVVKDNALRTTKLMEYKLSVDGYVTLGAGMDNIASSVVTMRQLLTQHGGRLLYSGRGFELLPGQLEVAWGPVPELVEFQPMGGGRSAKVKWEVTFRTCEVAKGTHLPAGASAGAGGAFAFPLLQFNYETSLTYGEDYYSSMNIKGTMEILMNRQLNTAADGRTLTTTVDTVRTELDRRIFAGIDLSRFHVARRNYSVSRDKRTMEFDVSIEEKAYMDMPPYCTVATGSYNVRPAKSGPGLTLWMCTLRASYTVKADQPRRIAWLSFLLLLKLRMRQAFKGNVITDRKNARQQNPQQQNLVRLVAQTGLGWFIGADNAAARFAPAVRNNSLAPGAWLIDFSFDEGLYKDSKTTTFSATWRMVTTLSHILLASGIWKKVPEKSPDGSNMWATSVRGSSGALGVLPNYLDPSMDVVIDFGY